MAHLSPEEGFSVLKDRVTSTVDGIFPIVGKKHTLKLDGIEVKDKLHLDDIQSQKAAKLAGRTWSVPVEATVSLVDNASGKKIDQQKLRLMELPKYTRRYSHIVDGQEYQIDNQWRLKPGVYSRVKDNGQLTSQFNLSKGRGFNLDFDPASRQFSVHYGNSNVPLGPLLQELGISSKDVASQWGEEIAKANTQDSTTALAKFYKASTGEKAPDLDTARRHLRETLAATEMRPEVNKVTLGTGYKSVSGDALLAAASKLLSISRGEVEQDPRDSLRFKDLHSAEDFLAERIQSSARDITRRVRNTLDSRKKVRDVIGPDVFNRPIRTMYRTSLANVTDQVNPLEMVSGQMKTTITGEGGIKSEHGISDEAKLIDPSHLGYLDPIHTPEGPSTGVSLRMPIAAKKRGHDVAINMYNLKTKKNELVTPEKMLTSNVVLPDQVVWKNGVPKAVAERVKISGPGNEFVEGSLKDAQYVMRDPVQMFSMASNLVPFMAADHPNRSTMAGRHMEQAISLKEREAPLVQEKAGKQLTFEKIMGAFASQTAPVDGTVTKVTDTAIIIKGSDGKKREVQLYDNFPLNSDKGFLHSQPLVTPGTAVKRGQVLADTNFSRNGELALGTNLRVGYMPFKGYNYEDGVVISESAAKKLSSEHLYRNTVERERTHVFDKTKFRAYQPERMTNEQSDKLDDEGVALPGKVIMPGDTIIAALRKPTDEERKEDAEIAKMHRSLVKPYRDASIRWDSDHPGVVTEVVKKGQRVGVHIKTLEPMEVGDKLAGRHGNKGIVVKVLSDDEMPKLKDGTPIQVLLNPTGVPGRTNLGQVMETAAAKIAEKTGKPYVVKNFQPHANLHQQVVEDLKKAGLTDKESVFDPKTGKKMGDVLVGPQYIVKLHHQVEEKVRARAGGTGYVYDKDLVPKGGGAHSAQSLGTLGLYSMLAHGAQHNLREMQTLKSDAAQGDDFWAALQAGELLPAPRPTFAYKKFIAYMNALGLNVKKEGNNLQLIPFTDKQVKEMSNGEIKDAGKMVRAKDMRPEKGGLFDPKVTGGLDGTNWAHIKLPEPMPNPVFEKPVQSLTGLTSNQFRAVLSGRLAVDPKTKKLTDDIDKGLIGGRAIGALLKDVDPKEELKKATETLNSANLKGNRLDQANKRVRYLRALDKAGLTPSEAYMMQYVPVLPPSFRPIGQLPDGTLNIEDMNGQYKALGKAADQYAKIANNPLLPPEAGNELRETLYDGLVSLTGIGGHATQPYRGVIDIISGKRPELGPGKKPTGKKIGSPKYGFFQSKLVQRKQDLSMRSTIVPEPSLALDEVGLPRKAALELYKPFVIKELRALTGISPLEAKKMVEKGGEQVNRALERVVDDRPILLKRDPVLHKYGIQAFKPRIVGGKAVQIHPLVTAGYNADFDGDAMSAFVPIGRDAVEEARNMMPSRNLFSPSSGAIMYTPSLESRLGLFGATLPGKRVNKQFANIGEVKSALRKGELEFNDHVKVGGLSSTTGRFLIAEALPADMRGDFLKQKALLDKDAQEALLESVAKKHKNSYGEVVNKLKDLGNEWSTVNAFSIGLEDIKPETQLRDSVLRAADVEAKKIMSGSGSKDQKDRKVVQIYDRATKQLQQELQKLGPSQSNLVLMNRAGIKPSMDTLRQIKMAPMLIANAKGEIIPSPVRKSYAEGLDITDYWTSMSGARKGIIQKVQQVQEPGYVSKQIMNSVMNNIITEEDCGTDKGISLAVDDKDVLDRFLAAPIKVGRKTLQPGTLVTPEVRNSLRNNKVGKVVVRSPLRCQHGPGICKKCYGLNEDGKLPERGVNVGVMAGQALGERATQLSMKSFHTGGSAASMESIVDEFQRVKDLLQFPTTLKDSATLASVAGKITDIQPDPAGGHNVFIDGRRHYVPQRLGAPVYQGKPLQKGVQVKRGATISAGPVNPHEMLPLTGVEPVQNHLAEELHKIYGPHGIRRKNVEVVVKAMTNLTKVEDPGDHRQFLRGDYAPTTLVANLNRATPKNKKPILHEPILKGVNVLPLEMHEDWIARLNHERLGMTIPEAAAEGMSSSIHGKHPIPAVVYGAEFGKGIKGEY